MVTTFPDAENSLSDEADDEGTKKYFLAISPSSGKTGSYVFHQVRTSTLLEGRFGSLK